MKTFEREYNNLQETFIDLMLSKGCKGIMHLYQRNQMHECHTALKEYAHRFFREWFEGLDDRELKLLYDSRLNYYDTETFIDLSVYEFLHVYRKSLKKLPV